MKEETIKTDNTQAFYHALDEIKRLELALHKYEKHPDYEYRLHPSLVAAGKILERFAINGSGDKLEEWQACYAKLFTVGASCTTPETCWMP